MKDKSTPKRLLAVIALLCGGAVSARSGNGIVGCPAGRGY